MWIAAFADEADCNDHLRIWVALDAVTWSGAPWRRFYRRGANCIPRGRESKRSLRLLSNRPSHERCVQRSDATLETLPIRAIAVPDSDIVH